MKKFTSDHVFVDEDGIKHFQSDKFPNLPPDFVAISLDDRFVRQALRLLIKVGGNDRPFDRDLLEVVDDKEDRAL